MKTSKIFISYSHEDTNFLNLLMTHLTYLEKHYSFEIWNDKKLKSGINWSDKIYEELKQSNIAILLISQHFLVSDFIIKVELPSILENVQSKGTRVIPIILSHCMFEDYKTLSIFQPINSPTIPLDSMNDSERNRIFKELTYDLKEYITNKKNDILKLNSNNEKNYSIIQLQILNCLNGNNVTEGKTISEIQKILNTANRKNLVCSLNNLQEYKLIQKNRLNEKTTFHITSSGSQLCNDIKSIFL